MDSSAQKNPWFAVSTGLLGLILGYGVATAQFGMVSAPAGAAPNVPNAPSIPPEPQPDVSKIPDVSDKDHVRGMADAEVTIIEYSDYECPFCTRHHPTMVTLLADYDGKVNWVYRHFPLSFHPNANSAAQASECVAELAGEDAFWKFTDGIFASTAPLSPEVIKSTAVQAGVNAAQFESCLSSGRYASLVDEQMQGGLAGGVGGTPGNVIIDNGSGERRLVSGAQPIGNFKTVIDEFLQ